MCACVFFTRGGKVHAIASTAGVLSKVCVKFSVRFYFATPTCRKINQTFFAVGEHATTQGFVIATARI